MKSKKELPYIPTSNILVRFDNGVYTWRNIKALFAFSDRFDVVCDTDIEIAYAPEAEGEESWVYEWIRFDGKK